VNSASKCGLRIVDVGAADATAAGWGGFGASLRRAAACRSGRFAWLHCLSHFQNPVWQPFFWEISTGISYSIQILDVIKILVQNVPTFTTCFSDWRLPWPAGNTRGHRKALSEPSE
jgi:hypothetical protein